jgi:hypothetical protein
MSPSAPPPSRPHWSTISLAGHACELYEPPRPLPGRGLVYLHGVKERTLLESTGLRDAIEALRADETSREQAASKAAVTNARDRLITAADPVGAWGGVTLLQDRHHIQPHLVTGPATDNLAGVSVIERETGIRGLNARHHAKEISEAVLAHLTPSHV